MSSLVRYCPSCAVARMGDDASTAYTKWDETDQPSVLSGAYEYCENDDSTHNEHHTFVINAEYWFDILEFGDICGNGCEAVQPHDDGVSCCCRLSVHQNLWQSMIDAIEREADAGVLDIEKWSTNFPKKVGELVKRSQAVAAAVLADKLPAVLVGVVVAYIW